MINFDSKLKRKKNSSGKDKFINFLTDLKEIVNFCVNNIQTFANIFNFKMSTT